MATTLEEFFADLADRRVPDQGDADLLELVQMSMRGFYVEILEMNDGEFYLLQVCRHTQDDWNIRSGIHPEPITQTDNYRFESLASVKMVFGAFCLFAVTPGY